MKKVFKIVLGIAVVFAVLFVLAILLTAIFFPAEKIKTIVENKASAALDMPVSTGKFGLSFAGIPALKVTDIEIGPPERGGQPLATVKSVRVMVNIFKLLKKEVEIVSVEIIEPRIHLVISEPDTLISEQAKEKTDQPVAPSLPFPVTLRTLRIKNGFVKMENPQTNTNLLLEKISQKLSVDISGDLKTLNSNGFLSIEDISFSSDEVKDPVRGLRIELEHELSGDLTTGNFSFVRGDLNVNYLPVTITGKLSEWKKGSFELKTGSLRIESMLKAVPSSLFPDMEKISSKGRFALSLTGAIDTEPVEPLITYDGSLDIENMSLSYSGFPKSLDNIETHINFSEKALDIKDFSVQTSNSKLSLSGKVKSYLESPAVSFKIAGKVDMDDVTGSLPVFENIKIDGLVNINLNVNSTSRDPKDAAVDGVISFRDFIFELPETLKNPAKLDGSMKISPAELEMETFAMTSGRSDFSFTGVLNNYKNLVFPEGNAGADFRGTLNSDLIDLNDLLVTKEKQESQSVKPWDMEETLKTMPVPPNLSVETSIQLGKVIFGKLKSDSVQGKIILKNGIFELTDLNVTAYKGLLSGKTGMNFSDIENVTYDGSLKLNGFESGEFISDFFDVGNFFRGKLSISLDFAGAGLDSLAMLENLAGDGIMRFDEGQIDNWDFTKKLGSHIKFLDFDTLDFDSIVNSFIIKDQKVITPDMKLKTEHGDILMNGYTGFDKSLDYDITLLLDKEASRKAARYLSSITDLVNVDAQSLEIAVKAGGMLTSPKFKMDTSRAKAQLKQEVKEELKSRVDKLIEEKISDEKLKEEGKKLLEKLFR